MAFLFAFPRPTTSLHVLAISDSVVFCWQNAVIFPGLGVSKFKIRCVPSCCFVFFDWLNALLFTFAPLPLALPLCFLTGLFPPRSRSGGLPPPLSLGLTAGH
ncbi:unnamed protein product [Prunus armeniaca]|uniref:Uncharacterized protein n=1 Tax=Prunus armeniaca TaxID=36596 RepID=A0A6J5X9E6_PRUAR|nr:unnamed protein product [Prunus armeniaca]